MAGSWAFEQIHLDDREKVISAAQETRCIGIGRRMEYRVRHKDGTWRVFESTASAIRNTSGEVEKLVIVNRDISDRKRAEQLLEHSALHDALTDLPNRTLFLDCLQRAFERAKKDPHYQFAVLFVDIDGLKAVNDSLGHSAGDQLITTIARRLTVSLRYDDTVSRATLTLSASAATMDDDVLARLGGDEFTILLGGINQPSDSLRVARRIQQDLSVPIEMNGQELFPSASIGIALSATHHHSAADMLRDAHIAMCRANTPPMAHADG